MATLSLSSCRHQCGITNIAMARRRRLSSTSSLGSDRPIVRDRTESSSSQGRVAYARRKKDDTWRMIVFQVCLVCSVLGVMAYTYYAFDHFHWHLTHLYAHHLDDHHAQHVLGHKLIKDHKNASAAFQWWRKAADAGHAHSAYNLAAGHLSGYRTDVKKGEVRQLLKQAAKQGVEEAKHLLRTLCKEKPKHCDL